MALEVAPMSAKSPRLRWLGLALLLSLAACSPRGAQQDTISDPAAAGARVCATCGQPAAPTEQTKTEWARVYRLYRCAAGHEEWAVDFETRRVNQTVISDPCPSCGKQLNWTGELQGPPGSQVKVMSCESGHIVNRRQ